MTIILDTATLTDLLRRDIAADTPLDAWPCAEPTGLSEPARAAAARVADEVTGASGHAVVRWAADDLSDEEVCSVGWNLFTLLCTPVPQYRSGELIYPVEVTEGAEEISHYSGSSRAGGHHTDGTLLPQPPDVACLFGLSAASGGETIVMDGARLCARLDAADVAALSRPVRFDVQGQQEGVTTKLQPVIRQSEEDDFELRYLRRYIESGYRVAGEDFPADLAAAMDRFDILSDDEDNQTAVLIARGTALIWDNRRMLHGRRPFRESVGKRRLRRVYGTADRAIGSV